MAKNPKNRRRNAPRLTTCVTEHPGAYQLAYRSIRKVNSVSAEKNAKSSLFRSEPEEQEAQRAQTHHLCYGTSRRIPTRVPLDQEGQQRQCGEECEKQSVHAQFWGVFPSGVISIWHGSGSFCTVSWICRRTAS